MLQFLKDLLNDHFWQQKTVLITPVSIMTL